MPKTALQRSLKHQQGQALIEMGLVLPLLLVLFLAVGYFGHAVVSLETLNAGSRSAARRMALESTETPSLRMNGNYDASREHFLELAQDSLKDTVRPEQLAAKEQTRLSHNYKNVLELEGEFNKLSEHRFVYALQESVDGTSSSYNSPAPQDLDGNPPRNLTSLNFGLGVVFYGGTLQYSLDELTPLSRFIFRFREDPVIRIGATSLMPAELPLRGGGYGLYELNPWLKNLIGGSVESDDYPDLIKD